MNLLEETSVKLHDIILIGYVIFRAKYEALTVSVDIPSGLFIDYKPNHEDEVVKPDFILSFQTPKLMFFLPETSKYVEQWKL